MFLFLLNIYFNRGYLRRRELTVSLIFPLYNGLCLLTGAVDLKSSGLSGLLTHVIRL